jgi:glycerol-1-phosphate dehydrogenase [NAD(P)+]
LSPIVIDVEAGRRLADYVRAEGWDMVLVVADANTHEVAGSQLARDLAGAGVHCRELIFPEREGLLAGPDEVERVRARLDSDSAAHAIAVGSGVLTDIVRYASHVSGREFITVPTAASMDGYASSVAALQIDGVKVTYPARAPAAIFADPRITAAAPAQLTRSGLGDLLAKATARVDWLAAHLLYGEPFEAAVAQRVRRSLAFAAANAESVLAGDAVAARSLLEGLLESGVAMALAGNSRPASGCEHHASHFWDLLAARGRRHHAPHGLQVGYATRFAIQLQRFAFGGGVLQLRAPAPVIDALGAAARAWLGDPTAEIVAAVEDKARFVAQPMAQDWGAIRAQIAPELDAFVAVERALDVAGFPAGPGYLEVDESALRATFRFATRLRARYTTVDFLEGQGVLGDAIEAMLA